MSEKIKTTLSLVCWTIAVAAYATHAAGIIGFEVTIMFVAMMGVNMIGLQL